jgi:hypothetical protein
MPNRLIASARVVALLSALVCVAQGTSCLGPTIDVYVVRAYRLDEPPDTALSLPSRAALPAGRVRLDTRGRWRGGLQPRCPGFRHYWGGGGSSGYPYGFLEVSLPKEHPKLILVAYDYRVRLALDSAARSAQLAEYDSLYALNADALAQIVIGRHASPGATPPAPIVTRSSTLEEHVRHCQAFSAP